MTALRRQQRAIRAELVDRRTPVPADAFRRQRLSGNPPIAPLVMGWVVRLRRGGVANMVQRAATPAERAWLKAHGYTFSGGCWCRADRRVADGGSR